jgi:hypothetical protein
MDVVVIKRSSNPEKKYDAVFKDKVVSFGNKNYSDFTLHKDEKRKENYIRRHSKNGETWSKVGVKTPGFLSRWVLWSKPTIRESVNDLNNKFKNIKFELKK